MKLFSSSTTLPPLSLRPYSFWLKRNWYYHRFFARFYQFMIPAQSRVLQINCKTGHLLHAVSPSIGVGVEYELECLTQAREQYPRFSFYDHMANIPDQTFDYIIMSSSIMEAHDIQNLLNSLHRLCHARTRLIIDAYSVLWEPILFIATFFKLRRPTPLHNWLSASNIQNFLTLTDFEIVTQGRQMLLPVYIPLISWLFNNIIALIPLIDRLCLNMWFVARPTAHKYPQKSAEELTCSIIIPCRNERGNIQAAVDRCPTMGKATEIIFVEGHSHDNTLNEIKRVAAEYPEKNIRYFVQTGKGKGDAVRLGFMHAQGDILMIQDADLTAMPEELPKFFAALATGKGDFINGSRLVYGMESGAMRFLNLIANYLFGIGFTWLLGQRIKDTLCGTKVLFKKDYEIIAHNRAFFGDFDPFGDFDLIFGAAKQHMKIIDLPVHYKNRTYGTTQISRFRHGILLLRMSWLAFVSFKFR